MTAAPTPDSPTLTLRPAHERGTTNLGWLDSRHSFSFGRFYDPAKLGHHGLRVLNDDRVAPGGGFGTHAHDNMEILSWVVEGGLAHRDSTGTQSILNPGTAQLMSAGTGVTHSEFNASDTQPVHFLQVWIEPHRAGLEPRYQERALTPQLRTNRFAALASPDGRDGGMTIHADAVVSVADLTAGHTAAAPLAPGRVAYAHVVTGRGTLNGVKVAAGDAVTLENAPEVTATTDATMQVLLFDLRG